MKKSTLKRLAGGLSASALALGMIAASQSAMAATPGTTVLNSKHNLSSTRANSDGDIYVTNGSGDTTQVCVFCHTPHGANTAMDVPLWNKASLSGTYTPYSMMGRDSLGTATVSGMSLACLSCHDGTQAMDAFMNAPGLHVNSTDGTNASAGYSWSKSDTLTNGGDVVNGLLNGGRTSNTIDTGPVFGTDLSNDHPIGMTYCGKQTVPGTCDDTAGGFITPTSLSSSIKIFSTTGSYNATGNNGTVECASCHNPHGTGNEAFLRVTRVGSAICLACHVK